MHTGASGDFLHRGVWWLLAFARFSAQGRQVTPRLCAQGHQRPLAFACFSAQGMRYSLHRKGPMLPWMSERAESSAHGSRWCGAGIMWMRGCTLPTVATECWAGIMWMRVSSTHGRLLLRGWYCVNNRAVSSKPGSHWWGAGIMWMRMSSTHGRPQLGGWYCVNKRAVSSKPGSRWWGAGIVWMSEEPSDCALHTAEHCSGAGGCILGQWVFPCGIYGDMRNLSSCICPRISAPPLKGDVRSRADVLNCRFDGWEKCGHLVSMSSSPESLRSTTDQGQTDSSLRKCHTHLNAADERPSRPALEWANLNCEL